MSHMVCSKYAASTTDFHAWSESWLDTLNWPVNHSLALSRLTGPGEALDRCYQSNYRYPTFGKLGLFQCLTRDDHVTGVHFSRNGELWKCGLLPFCGLWCIHICSCSRLSAIHVADIFISTEALSVLGLLLFFAYFIHDVQVSNFKRLKKCSSRRYLSPLWFCLLATVYPVMNVLKYTIFRSRVLRTVKRIKPILRIDCCFVSLNSIFALYFSSFLTHWQAGCWMLAFVCCIGKTLSWLISSWAVMSTNVITDSWRINISPSFDWALDCFSCFYFQMNLFFSLLMVAGFWKACD